MVFLFVNTGWSFYQRSTLLEVVAVVLVYWWWSFYQGSTVLEVIAVVVVYWWWSFYQGSTVLEVIAVIVVYWWWSFYRVSTLLEVIVVVYWWWSFYQGSTLLEVLVVVVVYWWWWWSVCHIFSLFSVISGWFLQAEETWGHADVPSREEAAKDVGRLWRWWGVEPAISCISASAAFHQPAVLISWRKRTWHSRSDDHSRPQVAVSLELPDIPRDLKGREEREKRTEKDIQMCRHTRFHELTHVYYVSRLRNHVTSMYDYFRVSVFIFSNYMFSLLWKGRWEDGVACSSGQAVSVWFWFIHSSKHYGIIFAFIYLVCLTWVC